MVTGGRLNAYASLTGRRAAPAAPPASPGGTAPPAAAPDRVAPQLLLRVKRRQRLRTLLRRGIRVTVQCSEACRVQARALIRGRPRRAESIASAITMAGRDSARLSASGRRVLVIKLRRSAKRQLAHARRATLVVRVNAADGAGNARAATRRINIRRR
jgi:hypothetical protein